MSKIRSKTSIKELHKIAKNIRKKIIETSFAAKIPHLGSCLSCVDILTYIYWNELFIDPSDPMNNDRDRFILSKGHGAPALFQVLAEMNFFSNSLIKEFGKNGSLFHEHPPKPGLIRGVEAATGSLGHGLPMALGMAISAKIQKKNFKAYALLSDGECNEGSIWEAALLAPSLKIDNLIAIIDYNKWQATGRSTEIMAMEPLTMKWESFGWDCYEIDGHNFSELEDALGKIRKIANKPHVIIAHTIKGKGISFMEDDNNWHYRTPNHSELSAALKELE